MLQRFPCSQAQKRFWFEEQLHPGNPGLNVAVRWRLEGDVTTAELEEAWRVILSRHKVLRTSFVTGESEPLAVIEPNVRIPVRVVDLTLLTEERALIEVDRIADIEAQSAFDITKAPLVRVTRLQLRENTSVLLVTLHHIVCDGWSVGILAAEMGEICAAQREGRVPELPELPIDFVEYAVRERDWLSTADLSEETAYAKRLVDGYKQFELAGDRPRPAIQTSNGRIVSALLDKELMARLTALSRANACTLFMTSLSALLVLLKRYSGENDIAIGTQVVGRDDVDVEHLVGCFINTIALRTDLSDDPTFTGLLERVRDVVVETFELRHFPLERLIEALRPKRDLSRNALFSVNFIFQRSFVTNETYGRFALVDMPSRSAGAIYDLNFFMVERPEGWRASCEYNADIFDAATVERLLRHFQNVLESVSADPSLRISLVPILEEDERRHILLDCNATDVPLRADATFPKLFTEQVTRTPDALAAQDETSSCSYAELDARAVALACLLRSRGIGPGAPVGVSVERSVDMLVSLLAVLKAGCAYVPLDRIHPSARLRQMVDAAGVAAVISDDAARCDFVSERVDLIDLRRDPSAPATASAGSLPSEVSPDSLAYVIFTSGSTGTPKGVEITHRALGNFLSAMARKPGLSAKDVLLAVTTISFDIAALELFLPLTVGATVAIATRDEVSDGLTLVDRIKTAGVSVMQATPATWRLLLEAGFRPPYGFKILCGGEALPRDLANRLLEGGAELWNMYGPTETTIWSSCVAVHSGDEPITIGRPIDNTQFYVLDSHDQPLPVGRPGQLHIGGDGVARGYVGQAELTAEKFVPNPFHGGRMYRTGDLARLLPSGEVVVIGRMDNQVKLRGFRIELGEIEHALLTMEEVADAAVIAIDDSLGEKMLAAYVVAAGAVAPGDDFEAKLRASLRRTLPGYMVPSLFVVLEKLPKSANGKLDRRALPAASARERTLDEGPLTPTEQQFSGLIGELLGVGSVPVSADIFELGFHSLLAARLVTQITNTFGVTIPFRSLFSSPTVRGLSRVIDEAVGGPREAVVTAPIVSLNANGTRVPFVYLHSDLYSHGLYCEKLAAALGSDQPFIAVAPHGTAGLPLVPTIEAMAADYLSRIRAVQPHGPYRLGGFCVSGLVAYELARMLRAQGEIVDDVILINASALPERSFRPIDWLVARFGLDARIESRLRERIIYNLARVNAAVVEGPRGTVRMLAELALNLVYRNRRARRMNAEPSPFEKVSGTEDTENSFAHLVAGLTYHPKPYGGKVTLIWGVDQGPSSDDPTIGWGTLAPHVRVVPIEAGHVTVLRENIGELARALMSPLREGTNG